MMDPERNVLFHLKFEIRGKEGLVSGKRHLVIFQTYFDRKALHFRHVE